MCAGRVGSKVACNLLAIERHRRSVPKSHRTHLLDGATPHKDCFVGYGRYTSGGVRIFAGRARLIPNRGIATDKVVFGYHSTVAFGEVVLRVFGIVNPEKGDSFRVPPGRLFRVWPPERSLIKWRRCGGLDDRGIDQLATYNHYIRR
jgi:hypothetical protein